MNRFILFLLFIVLFSANCLAAEQIDINNASLEQLDELSGIGPVYAQNIIDERPFSSVDDLLRVKGIGPSTLQKIKDQGLACVDCTLTQPSGEISNKEPSPAIIADETPAETSAYSGGIILNEVLPNPEGADETEEWIELYNQNDFSVNLSDWQIRDIEGSTTIYTLPKGTEILANGFLVLKRPDTKISLNNTGDGLNFYSPDQKIADSMAFKNAPLNQSYNKTGNGWDWSEKPTMGSINIVFISQSNIANALPKTKTSAKNDIDEAGLADLTQNIDLSQEYNNLKNPWFLFFIVLGITIVSASAIIFIKLKFQKNVRT